jgi:hypothetical protein
LENIFKMEIFQQKPSEVIQQHLTNTIKHKIGEDALKKRRKVRIIKRDIPRVETVLPKTTGKRKREENDEMEE